MVERRLGKVEIIPQSSPDPIPTPSGDRQGPPRKNKTAIGSNEDGGEDNGMGLPCNTSSAGEVINIRSMAEIGAAIILASKSSLELYANLADKWGQDLPWHANAFTQVASEVGLPPNMTLAVILALSTAWIVERSRH